MTNTEQTVQEIIGISFSNIDVEDILLSINDDLREEGEPPISLEIAMERAEEWGRHLEEWAIDKINDALASVIRYNQP